MPTKTPQFETLPFGTCDAVATITLNRPEQLNTIVPPMPDEIEAAIDLAERDPAIVLRGAGRACSGGYDFGGGFRHWRDAMMTDGKSNPARVSHLSPPARPRRPRSSWPSGGRPSR